MKRRNNFSWLEATKFVLSKSEGAMCQTQILQKISDLGLKDTRTPDSGEKVMRTLLTNSAGKNPVICKVEDKKFVINDNHKTNVYTHETVSISKRLLPARKKAKPISEDFIDSDSLIHATEEKVSYSPYSSHSFDHSRKNKRMRTRPVTSGSSKANTKPAILLKESVNATVQPSEDTRVEIQDMLNGNSDIMKYDCIARKCLNLEEFLALTKCQQRYLASYLPPSDVKKERNSVKLTPDALSNTFFNTYFREWQDKLGKGELSADFSLKMQAELDKQVAKDPWKETFFEDVWGFSRAEQLKSAKPKTRQRSDMFDDSIKEALHLIPSTFYLAPTPAPEPLQETLTPPTSEGSEHDRSHVIHPDSIDKDIQILTPDHEIDQTSMKLEMDDKLSETDQLITGFDSDVPGDSETPESSVVESLPFSNCLDSSKIESDSVSLKEEPSDSAVSVIVESIHSSDDKDPKNNVVTNSVEVSSIKPSIEIPDPPTSKLKNEVLDNHRHEQIIIPQVVKEELENGPKKEIAPLKLIISVGTPNLKPVKPILRENNLLKSPGPKPKSPTRPPTPPLKSPEKSILEMDFDLDLEGSIIDDYVDLPKRNSIRELDDPELTCDFIKDKSFNLKIEEPRFETEKVVEETSATTTVTKLAVSDDISLNIMDELKVDLRPQQKPRKLDTPYRLPEPYLDLKDYTSPGTSSASSSPRTDNERREKLTLKISKKDLILPVETPNVVISASPKKPKSKKGKSKTSYPYVDHLGPYHHHHGFSPDSIQYGMYTDEDSESELKRISLQKQLLAEKGIKTSSIPVEQTQSLVNNMREKQQSEGLPKLTKAPSDNLEHKSIPVITEPGAKFLKRPPPPYSRVEPPENIKSALKAKISQRYTPPSHHYPTLSSGNHCCYVVKGSPGECVCSTAPMLFCNKCRHLSHSSCSNVLCSNCGALFKFN